MSFTVNEFKNYTASWSAGIAGALVVVFAIGDGSKIIQKELFWSALIWYFVGLFVYCVITYFPDKINEKRK